MCWVSSCDDQRVLERGRTLVLALGLFDDLGLASCMAMDDSEGHEGGSVDGADHVFHASCHGFPELAERLDVMDWQLRSHS